MNCSSRRKKKICKNQILKVTARKIKPSAAFKKQHPIALIRGIKRVCDDIKNIKDKDPAAKSVFEIILLYPGFHARYYHTELQINY